MSSIPHESVVSSATALSAAYLPLSGTLLALFCGQLQILLRHLQTSNLSRRQADDSKRILKKPYKTFSQIGG
ncbi:hypothetical protein CC78DRAFT_537872 [Lojkania enalia]|uniref:Uncharacterized protein n=1 Tax=Lojkania enalia TaxID=147567 RepID=A0A9P4MXK2_9PLEO|nr:hypothetical protein CC78DRAFT_537872 [Didymosphaeria enalia]